MKVPTTENELEAVVKIITLNDRYSSALKEIRTVALNSEGAEFYAMLADKALESD
jgi:hypothetical protein